MTNTYGRNLRVDMVVRKHFRDVVEECRVVAEEQAQRVAQLGPERLSSSEAERRDWTLVATLLEVIKMKTPVFRDEHGAEADRPDLLTEDRTDDA